MAGESDDAIIRELRQGDGAAWREVYRRLQPRVYSYLARLAGRPEVAQDLSSEVWCRAAAKVHGLRPGSELLPWLFTIARNLFFSYCRWRSRDDRCLNELARAGAGSPPPLSPLEHALQTEQEALLEEKLMQLPRHYRDVLLLVGVEGLAHEQAAQVMAITVTAVRKRYSRAIQLLKKSIAGGREAGGGGI
jgi:RNA polymerase sigma-70 factor (ECF subfamily)